MTRWNRFSVVNDPAEIVSAGSMTPPNRFFRRILGHMQNCFNPWIRALGGIDWWKNRGSKISCNCPFKEQITLISCFVMVVSYRKGSINSSLHYVSVAGLFKRIKMRTLVVLKICNKSFCLILLNVVLKMCNKNCLLFNIVKFLSNVQNNAVLMNFTLFTNFFYWINVTGTLPSLLTSKRQ
jgi:hypothetical protein